MQSLQDQAHKFLLADASHRVQVSRIEEEARALLTAQPAPFGIELEDDDEEEFFPENPTIDLTDPQQAPAVEVVAEPTKQKPKKQKEEPKAEPVTEAEPVVEAVADASGEFADLFN
jgi:hypothetical protein